MTDISDFHNGERGDSLDRSTPSDQSRSEVSAFSSELSAFPRFIIGLLHCLLRPIMTSGAKLAGGVREGRMCAFG